VDAFVALAPAEDLWVPVVHHDDAGVSTQLVIQNTDGRTRVSPTVKFRPDGTDEKIERSITIAAEAAEVIDLTGLPRGAMSVEIDGPVGAKILATAYHLGPTGLAAAHNAFSDGGNLVGLPLVFTSGAHENWHTTLVRIMKVGLGAAEPRITLRERDTGARIGPIIPTRADGSPVVLVEGQGYTWNLSQLSDLPAGKAYSAEIDNQRGGGIGVVANFLNSDRNLVAAYPGIDARAASESAIAPLVMRNADGATTTIHVQNISGGDVSVAISFLNRSGRNVATQTATAQARSSTIVYLPDVPELSDGFVGSAVISGGVGVVVSTGRHRETPSPTPG
jgi:hypothetical protein